MKLCLKFEEINISDKVRPVYLTEVGNVFMSQKFLNREYMWEYLKKLGLSFYALDEFSAKRAIIPGRSYMPIQLLDLFSADELLDIGLSILNTVDDNTVWINANSDNAVMIDLIQPIIFTKQGWIIDKDGRKAIDKLVVDKLLE